MSEPSKQALCCVCGNVRTFRRSRNHREENWWFNRAIDLDWHRETGDLKCEQCGKITTHALLHPEGDRLRDHAEMMQRVATGNSHSHFDAAQLERVAEKYRQGLPRNPEMKHLRYEDDAQAAWDAGERTVRALCWEPMEIHRDPSQQAPGKKSKKYQEDGQIKPRVMRDQEYEDEETGLWWQEVDCTDCLRTWHLELLRQHRKKLIDKLTPLMADLLADGSGGYPKRVDLTTVDGLMDVIEASEARGKVRSKDSTS